MPPRPRGRRPLVCHHEAGHAVARWWLGFPTDDAAVLSVDQARSGAGLEDREGDEVRGAEGIVNGPPIAFVLGRLQLDGLGGDERAWMERQGARRVEAALVASAAGTLAEAAYRRRSSLDCFLAGGAGDHDNARAIAASWHEAEADQRAVRDRADRIARALVRSPKGWAAVQAVAAALLARGRVDGDEVDALCAAAYGAPFVYDRWAACWPPTPAQIRAGFLPAERGAREAA